MIGDLNELEELLPGDQVQDVDGDRWRRTASGTWTCMTNSMPRMSSADLFEKYGPMRTV